MAKRDTGKPTYYLDANVLIDLIEHPASEEPAKTMVAILEAAESGKINLVTSTITIAEVVYAKKEIDGRCLDPEITAKIESLWHPQSSPIRLVDVHELIVRDATQLLRDNLKRGWTKTKGVDAVHLVTARREFADEFFSKENAMKKWEEIIGCKFCAPHCLTEIEEHPNLFEKPADAPPESSEGN